MTEASKPFEATWDSLKHYEIPRWFQDAKLGIFIHCMSEGLVIEWLAIRPCDHAVVFKVMRG